MTKFEYLGTIIHQCGKIQEEVNNRVTKCNRAYYQINQTIFGKKEINPQTKFTELSWNPSYYMAVKAGQQEGET